MHIHIATLQIVSPFVTAPDAKWDLVRWGGSRERRLTSILEGYKTPKPMPGYGTVNTNFCKGPITGPPPLICSGAGMNLKVGAPIRRKAPENFVWSRPSTFWL